MNFSFEWDTNKAKINLKKHQISFEEGKTIFADPFLITTLDEEHSDKEERFISIGTSTKQRILLVIHLEKIDFTDNIVIRIISCRKATSTERKIYEENK
ncbi:MAG: BrnT family toxin [Anaerolineales bacterium]|nr:BrnT family toxin [Anaerolineales bacterium]